VPLNAGTETGATDNDVPVNTPEIEGFGHIDLTVTDGERSVRWWHEVMGFVQVALTEKEAWTTWHMAHPSSGLVVSVMTHRTRASESFDEQAIGLDHLAFRVKDRVALEAWAKHLDRLGVVNSGVQEESGGALIVLRDPDNIQIEVWAPGPGFAEGLERLRSTYDQTLR
jgi:catechol 2,3-dioxygenase-like lactoylglutathione lyase family enzyme